MVRHLLGRHFVMARRTTCPAGRPLYRYGELPDGLATRTMLGRMRRRLAEGQQPVASYKIFRGYVPLYEVAGSVELPPLTAGRKAAYARARTCARCAATQAQPYGLDREGRRRLCPGCRRLEGLAWARPSWLRGRMEAVGWAADVLTDASVVLVHGESLGPTYSVGWPVRLYAATLAGEVLLHVTVYPRSPVSLCRSRQEGEVLAVDVAQAVHELAARRLVAWYGGPLDFLRRELFTRDEAAGELVWPSLAWPAGAVLRGDEFGPRYTAWRAKPLGDRVWYGQDGLERQRPPDATARQIVELMAARIRAMAVDEHPEGPPVCPVLPDTGLEPCGADIGPAGVCEQHASTVEAP